MDDFLSRKNLLGITIFLVVVKFLLLPILAWQENKIQDLTAKYRQLTKISDVVEAQDDYSRILSELKMSVKDAEGYFYVDSDALKLTIQKDMESIFEINGLVLRSFNWVLDSKDNQRRLRAKVSFSGNQEQMIRTYWDLSANPQLVQLIESRQKMKFDRPGQLGATEGNVTLEFYALKTNYFENIASSTQQKTGDQVEALF